MSQGKDKFTKIFFFTNTLYFSFPIIFSTAVVPCFLGEIQQLLLLIFLFRCIDCLGTLATLHIHVKLGWRSFPVPDIIHAQHNHFS